MPTYPTICAHCNVQFDATTKDRKYCSLKCRNAEKRQRERIRDGGAATKTVVDDRFVFDLHNPQLAEVHEMIRICQLGMVTGRKYIRMTGLVPEVQAPPEVELMKVKGHDEPDYWIMQGRIVAKPVVGATV